MEFYNNDDNSYVYLEWMSAEAGWKEFKPIEKKNFRTLK